MERFDHIWGLYVTRAGRIRRMDIMLVRERAEERAPLQPMRAPLEAMN